MTTGCSIGAFMTRFSTLTLQSQYTKLHLSSGDIMARLNDHPSGRHFLQIPGPTNVPDRVLRAIDQPTIDHRGPEFGRLTLEILDRLKQVFQTESPVIIYPASGTGAWEAALVNTLSPGDRVLMFETGHFATLWRKIADRLGLVVDFVPGDWRSGADPAIVEARLGEDKAHAIKAVLVVHNETSTGVTSRIAAIRQAIDRAGHPALFMVDTVSGLGSTRLSSRRVGCRRHRRRIAEGSDAAARACRSTPSATRRLAPARRRVCRSPTGDGTTSSQ